MKRNEIIKLFIILFFIGLLFTAYHTFQAWGTHSEEIYRSASAAIMGVVITTAITYFLLTSQSDNDTARERDARVYEQKLSICLEFINEICAILEDGNISREEANKLKFTFSKVAIHLSDENLKEISEHLSAIAQNCDELNSTPIDLSNQLMDIVYVIRKAIYPHKAAKMKNEAAKESIIKNLKTIDNKVVKIQDTTDSKTEYEKLFNGLAAELNKEFQHTSVKRTDNNELLLTSKYPQWKAEKLSIKMAFNKNGEPYYQISAQLEYKDAEERLYPSLKEYFGGNFTSGAWKMQPEGETGKQLRQGHWSQEELKLLINKTSEELIKIAKYINTFIENYDTMEDLKKKHSPKNWRWTFFEQDGIALVHTSNKVECSFRYNKEEKQITDVKLVRFSDDVKWNPDRDTGSLEIEKYERATEAQLPELLKELDNMFSIAKAPIKIGPITWPW